MLSREINSKFSPGPQQIHESIYHVMQRPGTCGPCQDGSTPNLILLHHVLLFYTAHLGTAAHALCYEKSMIMEICLIFLGIRFKEKGIFYL